MFLSNDAKKRDRCCGRLLVHRTIRLQNESCLPFSKIQNANRPKIRVDAYFIRLLVARYHAEHLLLAIFQNIRILEQNII